MYIYKCYLVNPVRRSPGLINGKDEVPIPGFDSFLGGIIYAEGEETCHVEKCVQECLKIFYEIYFSDCRAANFYWM